MSELSRLARSMAQDYRENDSIGPTLLAFAVEMETQEREIQGLRTDMRTANANAEEFERKWYLRGDELEQLRAQSLAILREAAEKARQV